MENKYIKTLAIAVAVFMITSIFSGCTSKKETDSQKTSTVSASASVTKTVVTTAAKSTGNITPTKASATVASAGKETGSENSTVESGDAADTGGADNESDSTAAQENGSNADNIVEEGKAFDLGGKTLVYAYQTTSYLPGPIETQGTEQYTIYQQIQKAEEKYNFKMAYKAAATSAGYYNDILNSAMAGIKYSDLLFVHSGQPGFVTLTTNKVLIPLDDYMDFVNDPLLINSKINALNMWKDKHYTLSFSSYFAFGGIIYNKSILDKEGLPAILDLYDNGQWTWETFNDYAIKCTRDFNGDAIIDQWGITTFVSRYILTKICDSNGLEAVGFKDGKFTFNYNEPQMQRAMQFMTKLVYVDKVFTTSGSLYNSGLVAMCLGDVNENLKPLQLGIDSWNAPLPKGPDCKNEVRITVGSNGIAINSLCDVPAETATILKESWPVWDESGSYNALWLKNNASNLSLWDPAYPNRWFASERDWKTTMRYKTSIIKDYTNCLNVGTNLYKIAADIIKGISYNSAIDTYKPLIEAVLDQYSN